MHKRGRFDKLILSDKQWHALRQRPFCVQFSQSYTYRHTHTHLHKFEIFTSRCHSKCSNNSQSLFCFEGIKNIVAKKMKAVKYLFHHEFCIRIVVLKHQKKPLNVFLLQSVFLENWQIFQRNLWRSPFLVKVQVESLELY